MRTVLFSSVFVVFALVLSYSSRGEDKPAAGAAATSRPASSQPATRAATSRPSEKRVVLETSLGQIVIELTPDQTPITVKNFLTYVDEKFYDGTIFHRTMKRFMIQGGGFTPELKEKETHRPIKNESEQSARNSRGTIAMARRPDPDSATAQFFINLVDNKPLDYPSYGGYAVFGKVVEGMDVVDKIANVPVKRGISEAQPIEPVLIRSIRRAMED